MGDQTVEMVPMNGFLCAATLPVIMDLIFLKLLYVMGLTVARMLLMSQLVYVVNAEMVIVMYLKTSLVVGWVSIGK